MALEELGIDIKATRSVRRRFAYSCLNRSERRPHLGGGLAAALLQLVLEKRWGRTPSGRKELKAGFGIAASP